MNLLQLEEYFKSIELPKEIRLNRWTYVTDVPKFVYSNISYLKAHSGNMRFMPYYNQLIELKKILDERDTQK